MPTALAISPHLDDAVFSAGGVLARLARGGWRVVVATVFTASVPEPTGFALACQLDKGLPAAVDYMALRRDEDAAACAVLGVEPRWLPFAEAPHRGYGSAAELFGGLHRDDDIVDLIAPALAELVEALAPDQVLAPQAIGAHVDHVAVYMALRAGRRPLRLWADYPYLARVASRRSPFADDMADWDMEAITLDADEVCIKTDAATCYTSQLGFQFGGSEAARRTIGQSGAIERMSLSPEAASIRPDDRRS